MSGFIQDRGVSRLLFKGQESVESPQALWTSLKCRYFHQLYFLFTSALLIVAIAMFPKSSQGKSFFRSVGVSVTQLENKEKLILKQNLKKANKYDKSTY